MASSQRAPIESKLYQQQVLPAMAAGDDRRRPKRDEVQQRLTAIKSIADEFVEYEDYIAAFTVYEVLVSEVIEHFNVDSLSFKIETYHKENNKWIYGAFENTDEITLHSLGVHFSLADTYTDVEFEETTQ